MDWLLGNAVGNIKLQVPQMQAERAAALVEQIRRERQDREESEDEVESNVCLACGAELADEASRCSACGWSYISSEAE